MKNKIFLCAWFAIVGYAAGYITSLKVNTDSVESAQFKRELIKAQYDALEQAEKVMDNNDLWDADGSDDMYEYMQLKANVDCIINSQI